MPNVMFQIYDLSNQAYNFLFETLNQAEEFAKKFLGLDICIIRQVSFN